MNVSEMKFRYENDAGFRMLVHTLEAFMTQHNTQPYEVKDAAFYAELLYRQKHVGPLIFDPLEREGSF